MAELWTPNGVHEVRTPDDKKRTIDSLGSFSATAFNGGTNYHALAAEALKKGREGQADNSDLIAEMRRNRQINKRAVGSSSPPSSGTAQFSFATGRPRDPLFYWRENNLPYDIAKDEELEKIRAFCSDPSAPVWMGDYSFKNIGDVRVGDDVIGWTWYHTGASWISKLTRTPVLAIKRRIAPERVKITMESGRQMICTPDHHWANPSYSPGATDPVSLRNQAKREAYLPAKVGRKLRHVIDPTPMLDPSLERTAAWLAGMYDGEGHAAGIAQVQSIHPHIYQAIQDGFDALGLPHSDEWQQVKLSIPTGDGGGSGKRRGGFKQHFVNFLNWLSPVDKVNKANDKKILTTNFGVNDRVVSIESIGPGEVVSMQTGTGNYVVYGYASRNCRLLYITHPVISSAIDIYSRFPMIGMELKCKDQELVDFYGDLFFTQLDYMEFLIDVGREFWTVGEVFPLGSFNETLGVWESDELINPDDVTVIRSPFLKEPRFEMKLPEVIREVILNRQPQWEYEALLRVYPELARFTREDSKMAVSNILLKHIKFKADTFHPRGIPILMRGFRAIIQEEMLNAAQDAIAERLYTPLILAKLGASATDLGTDMPWVPTPDDLQAFEDALDAALAGDFRILIHHFAVEMESVFGRETMPDFTPDFDRLTDKELQVFGLSKTMLNGADAGETYAGDALNRDLVTQLLTVHQRKMGNFYKERALVVAEAQEHYDYEERNGKKYPLMEEILEVDEETGEERIVEQPKLLVPEIEFKVMSMSNEKDNQDFLEALRASGIPISMKARLTNVPITLDEEIEISREETVNLAVENQETRKQTYLALLQKGLPIPPDLAEDFAPHAQQQGVPNQPAGTEGGVIPQLGQKDIAPTDAIAPTPTDLAEAETATPDTPTATQTGTGTATSGPSPVDMLPRNKMQKSRPDESDEMRGDMPKASRLERGPQHIGSRRFRQLDRSVPLDEQLENPVWPV